MADDIAENDGGTFEATETLKHVALDDEKPGNGTQEETSGPIDAIEQQEIDVSSIEYKTVWHNLDDTIKQGVSQLWDEQTYGQMTEEMKRQRMDSVCVVAYDGEKVVAVSTMLLQKNQSLWCKIGYFRCIVHSDYRRKGVATQLAMRCKTVLADYSKEHPDQRIQAFGMNLSAKTLGDRGKQPFWPELGMAVVGYNQAGMQLRIAWLDHVRLDY